MDIKENDIGSILRWKVMKDLSFTELKPKILGPSVT